MTLNVSRNGKQHDAAVLIDDLEAAVEELREHLLSKGYDVRYAKDFGKGLELIQELNPKFVSIDSRLTDELSDLISFDLPLDALLATAKDATFRGAAYYIEMKELIHQNPRTVVFYTALNPEELAEYEYKGEKIPRGMIFHKHADPDLNWLDNLLSQ